MKLSVIGCGYLGAVHASAMAELGHEVVGIDVDAAQDRGSSRPAGRRSSSRGCPRSSPRPRATGRLRFTHRHRGCRGRDRALRRGRHAAVAGRRTPPTCRYVDAAFEALLPHLAEGDLVVGKSTVPVGTAARLAARLAEAASGAALAWNPEFLREGFAVKDTLEPDRLVYGVDGRPRDVAVLDEVYARGDRGGTPRIVTDYATAELVKVAANAFLATKISFINAMAEIAEATGADVTALADAIGHDARIGRRFLNAGVGFGGGCLPEGHPGVHRARRGARPRRVASRSSRRSTRSTCGGGSGSSTSRVEALGGFGRTARRSPCSA